jgi:hypothetical protein
MMFDEIIERPPEHGAVVIEFQELPGPRQLDRIDGEGLPHLAGRLG